MYEKGNGIPKDHQKALEYFYLAAEQGELVAHANLGAIYGKVEDHRYNPVLAYIICSLMATRGNEAARRNRDIILNLLTSEQLREGQRLASEWQIGTPLPTPRDVITWP